MIDDTIVRTTEAQRKKHVAQAKDIPDDVLIALIAALQKAPTVYRGGDRVGPKFVYFTASGAMFRDICAVWRDLPPKVVREKLKRLIERGFITGCVCGCRGDFEVK